MNKKILSIIITLIMLLSLSGCSKSEVNDNTGKIKIAASFNPISEFAKAVGGDKVQVYTIIPQGTEPHDFELKAQDLKQLSEAKLFIYNGLGMEPWVDKALSSISNSNLIVVNASDNCYLIKNSDSKTIQDHGEYDPHIWLSLKNAKIEAQDIKDALIKADPSNKAYYESNYSNFEKQLDGLYEEYKTKLESVGTKHFVTGHAAFAYLCNDFNLQQSSVENVFAEGEPTPQKMQSLIEYCKKNNVKTIFMEELASPKVSETLAQEIGGKVKKIYTVESKEDNMDYLQSMKANLESIYESLK